MDAPDFVVQIHSALAVRYGRRWLAMWAGLDMELVRADWRRVLRQYAGNPAAVMHALDNLAEHVPTVFEFRALCESAPRPATLLLSGPMVSDEGKRVMRDLLARLRAPVEGELPHWADQIDARVRAGEQVSQGVREMAARARGRV